MRLIGAEKQEKMRKYTVGVDGMMCGMCEAHVSDAVRRAVPSAKKVSSSRSKKQTTFLTEEPVDEDALRSAIDATGYTCLEIRQEPWKKRGLFG